MRTSRFFLFWVLLPVLIFANINTQPSPSLSSEDLAAREKLRREIFYKSDLRLNPNISIQGILHKEPRPFAAPLDGQTWKENKDFTLYLGQFYRFLVQSDKIPSHLFVQVYEGGKTIHEERIALPQRRTPAWESYVMEDGMLLVPETKLTTQFGLHLYLTIVPDVLCPFSIVVAQKGTNSKFQFSISLDGGQSLYQSQFTEPPPWQLGELSKPGFSVMDRTLTKYPRKVSPFINEKNLPTDFGKQVERFPKLDRFVEELKKDPLALAQFVYNEIELVDPFLRYENGVLLPAKIHRTAYTTFLEKQGSAWEQCSLLVYLLRQAGYKAVYALGDPYSLPKEFVEKMLFTRFPGEEDVLLQYPWVVFFDGEKWISIFPWMKEVQITEGYDLYNLLPKEYASADRWILHYLKNDHKILELIRADGDDTAGVLFIRFVEEELKKQGLSLADVGIHRTLLKKQFLSWKDFPHPLIEKEPIFFTKLSSNKALFAQVIIRISEKGNPQNQNFFGPFVAALNNTPYFIRFTSNNEGSYFVLFGNNPESNITLDLPAPEVLTFDGCYLNLGPYSANSVVEITVIDDLQHQQTFSITKGVTAALCFHCGGASSELTSLSHERLLEQTISEERSFALLAYIGASYFEKCCRVEQTLANLHKVKPMTIFAAGLAKFSPDLKGNSFEVSPQVDMSWVIRTPNIHSYPVAWHQEMHTASRQFLSLNNVNQSSYEHQILNETFEDSFAISTVKLLQLSHGERQAQNIPGTGFIGFSSASFAEADKKPEAVQPIHRGQLKEPNYQSVKDAAAGQWNMTKIILNPDNNLSDFALAYMTSGPTASEKPDGQSSPTYQEMGTLIFHPSVQAGLISIGSIVLKGGAGSYIPQTHFSSDFQSQLTLGPKGTAFKTAPQTALYNSLLPFQASNQQKANVGPWYKTSWDSVADPVDIVSGAFYIDEVDLTLPGSFPLEIRRNYNSQNPIKGDLGCGWKISLNPYLIEQEGKRYVAEQDGTVIVYRPDKEQSRWIVHPEDNPDLRNFNSRGIGGTANPFHAYIEDNVLYGTDGSKRYFEDGLLKKWVNAAGNTLTFTYENNKQLSQVESSQGNFLGIHYNPEGKISEIYARDGRRVTYNYDYLGDLRRVKLPNDAVISYEYDKAHQITKETKPHGRVLVNEYIDGRVEKQSSPMGPQQSMTVTATFEYEDGLTKVTDANKGCTTYKIFQKQIYKIIDPLGYETLQSWFIDEKSYFDPVTERVVEWNQPGGWQRSLKSSTDKRGLVTYYLYDKRGNPEVMGLQGEDLTGDGQKEIAKKLFYNDQNLCFQEEACGQKTLITYDQAFPYLPKKIEKYSGNSLLSYTEMDYYPYGQLKKENRSGAVTLWEYEKGFPRKKTQVTGTEDPDVVTTYDYNNQGQCIKVTAADSIQESEYDIMGNMWHSKVMSGSGMTLLSETYIGYNQNNEPIWKHTANPNNVVYLDYHASGRIKASRQVLSPTDQIAYCLYDYDKCGYLIEEVDLLGYCTYRDYDLLGRVKSETKENHSTLFTYEAGGLVESVTTPSGAKTIRRYTTNGLLKEETYPDGTKSSVVFDFFGRPLQETKKGITWEVTYDDAHHRVIRTHSESKTKEIQEFDERGNLIRFTDAAGFVWIKTYDGLGRLKTETTPKGEKTVWSYQKDLVICTRPNGEKAAERYEGGQIAESEVIDAKEQIISKSLFHYDPVSDIQTVTHGDKTTTTRMNALGLPVEVKKGDITTTFEYDACGHCIASTDGENRTTRQRFDGLGRLSLKQLPDGAILTYGYDLDSNLNECKLPNKTSWMASYDEMGRKDYEKLQAENEISLQWTYIYENGYLKKTIDPKEREHTYHYDELGRLDGENVDKWQRIYTYDPRGMLKTAEQMKEGVPGWFYTSKDEHSLVARTYDPDGHLKTETISLNSNVIQETTQKWSPFGRSLEVEGHKRGFVYQNNQLVQVSAPHVNLAYTYDQRGSLKSKNSPVTMTLEYNASGLPETIHTDLREGRHEQILKWDHSGKLSSYSAQGQQKTFSYKPRGHLEKAGEEAFDFDFGMQGTGVRTAAPNQYVKQDGMDSFGKIESEITGQGLIKTKYNQMGEMILQDQRKFEWDPWGRLLRVMDGGLTWEASYDALGRRLETRYKAGQRPTLTTTSFYDPEEEFGELGIKYGNKTFWKFYGTNACDAVSDENGNVIYLMQDALRQLVGVITDKGIQYSEQVLSAYGPQTDPSLPTDLLTYALSLSWHSKSQDPTGLIWMGARYYDPKGGRFISPDPVSYPVSMDLYVYAGGDPVNYFDPDGRFFSHTYQKVKPSVINVWNNPRFQGGLQVIGGAGEIGAGYAMTFGTGGAAAPIGYLVGLHGVDHVMTGFYTLFTGKYKNTATHMALQGAGLSSQAAGVVDCGLGFAGMGAGAWIEANRAVTASMRVSEAARYGSMPEYFSVSRPAGGATLANSGKVHLPEGIAEFKSFTRRNFRDNLAILTESSPGKTLEAHHVLPQQYKDIFLAKGINIHDPKLGVWWEKTSHRGNAKDYNLAWEYFIQQENPNATIVEILEKGRQLMLEYGMNVNY